MTDPHDYAKAMQGVAFQATAGAPPTPAQRIDAFERISKLIADDLHPSHQRWLAAMIKSLRVKHARGTMQ